MSNCIHVYSFVPLTFLNFNISHSPDSSHNPENAATPVKSILILGTTRGGPCQHGFMCGCRQWSNNMNESN